MAAREQRSIRTHLVLLIVGVTLPLFVLVAWGFVAEVERERQQSRDLALRIAHSIASDLHDGNVRADGLLSRMATRPRIRAGNSADCDALFPIVDFFPQYLNLQLFDAGGGLVCSSTPQAADVPFARPAEMWVHSFLASHSAIPQDPVLLPIRGRWISIAFREVPASKLVLTLVQYLDFNIDATPIGTVVSIVDDGGRVVARSLDPNKWVGQVSRNPEGLSRREGSAELPGLDGVLRQYGYTSVPSTHWRVFVGIPSSVAMASVRTLVLQGGIAGVLVIAALVAWSLRLSRSIERPLGALAAAANRVEDLGYTTPVSTSGPREIALVAAAFNRMVSRRAEAQAALLESRNELEALSDRLLKLLEEDRTRVAREIHDELGQSLTALKIDFGGLLSALTSEEELKPMIDRIRKALDETVASVRRIAAELRPPILDDFGFLAALESDIRGFEVRTGIECELSVPTIELSLPAAVETAAYRIVQEAMTNVARHANASRLEIRLRVVDHEVLLDIRDDGRGLDAADLHRRGALGLVGIRERARQIGATVEIEGFEGQGTIVSLRIPAAPAEVTA